MTTGMSLRALARPAAVAAVTLLVACATGRGPAARGAGGAARAGWTRHDVEIPGHGRLLLSLPPGWAVTDAAGGDDAEPGVRLTRAGVRFLARLTPMWNPGEPESPQARADSARLFVELARHEALAGSVERELPVEELVGPGVRGAYFSATDRSLVGREARPEEFRHLLQGAAAVGPVIVAFSLLDDGPGPWRAELLEIVRTARHAPDGDDDEREALEAMPGVRTEPLRVTLPGRSWAVLVDLPGFEVARVAPGRAGPGVEHVVARSAETDVVASVLLTPAGGVRDAAGCRERALARIRASVPGLDDVRRADGGGAAAVTYVVAGAGGAPEWHAHAFLWREAVCVGVHVSKAEPDQADVNRLDAILSSVRVAEDL
jgi:hypothetical protein